MMSIFLFSTFYLLIWPSLALDGLSQQEYKGDVDKNLHRSSKITTHCICGLFSLKCCRRKSTLKKVSLFYYFEVAFLVMISYCNFLLCVHPQNFIRDEQYWNSLDVLLASCLLFGWSVSPSCCSMTNLTKKVWTEQWLFRCTAYYCFCSSRARANTVYFNGHLFHTRYLWYHSQTKNEKSSASPFSRFPYSKFS